MLAGVDDERGADRLPALRAAAAARQERRLELARDGDRDGDVVRRPRHEDADRHDLVDRRVGRIASARGDVEQHFAARFCADPARQFGGVGPAARRTAGRLGVTAGGSGAFKGRLRPRLRPPARRAASISRCCARPRSPCRRWAGCPAAHQLDLAAQLGHVADGLADARRPGRRSAPSASTLQRHACRWPSRR